MQSLLLADIAGDLINSILTVLSTARVKVDRYIVDNGPTYLENFAAAAAIFYFGKWAARIADRVLGQLLSKAKIDETLSKFLCRMANVLIMANVALAALAKLGINTTSLAAVIAAAGLAVGMALQGSLSNFAAGVLIILFRPLKVGDFVEAAGTKGIVEEINVFNTLLRTPDNVEIIVPNNAITGGNITNYSSKPTRRIDLVVGCGYRDDLAAVKRFLEQTVANDPRVLRDPAPVVAVSDLAESSVNFVVRPWVTNANYWAVRWDLTEKIKLGFDQYGFTIPFPQRELHIQAPPALAAVAPPLHRPEAAPLADSMMQPATSALTGPRFFDDGLTRPRRAA